MSTSSPDIPQIAAEHIGRDPETGDMAEVGADHSHYGPREAGEHLRRAAIRDRRWRQPRSATQKTGNDSTIRRQQARRRLAIVFARAASSSNVVHGPVLRGPIAGKIMKHHWGTAAGVAPRRHDERRRHRHPPPAKVLATPNHLPARSQVRSVDCPGSPRNTVRASPIASRPSGATFTAVGPWKNQVWGGRSVASCYYPELAYDGAFQWR